MERGSPGLNLKRSRATKDIAAVKERLYLSDAAMAQIADQNDKLLKKGFDSCVKRQRSFMDGSAGASYVIEQVRDLVSGQKFPERISRVMARPEGEGDVHVIVVHEYETHAEAFEASRICFGAVKDGVPGSSLGFSYVESDRFEAKDYLGFVDVLPRPGRALGAGSARPAPGRLHAFPGTGTPER